MIDHDFNSLLSIFFYVKLQQYIPSLFFKLVWADPNNGAISPGISPKGGVENNLPVTKIQVDGF